MIWSRKKPVPAMVVGAEHPVPAEVVVDHTSFWRRLPIVLLILLVIFFVVTNLKTSSQNNDLLHKAIGQNQQLIGENHQLLATNKRDEDFVIAASKYLQDLKRVIQAQNRELKAHGLHPVPIPPPPQISNSSSGSSSGRPRSSPTHHPSPRPSHHPSHHPSPRPSPSPSEKCTLRNPVTGDCIVHQD